MMVPQFAICIWQLVVGTHPPHWFVTPHVSLGGHMPQKTIVQPSKIEPQFAFCARHDVVGVQLH
jgi:hypothetical protein